MDYIYHLAPIKIILTLFALFAWSRVYLKFRARLMNVKELIFWTLIWATAITVVFIPGKTTTLARLLGMERGFDAFAFIGIVTVFYIVYRLYVKTNEIDQTITELVRQIALGQVHKVHKVHKQSLQTSVYKVFKVKSRQKDKK